MMNSSTVHQHERLDYPPIHDIVWTAEAVNLLILLGFMDRIDRRRQISRKLQIHWYEHSFRRL